MPFSGVILVIGVLLGVTTLVGIFGNFAVCLVVWWNKNLRSQLSLFLICLAVSDIGMSASCMPFAVATVLFHEQHIGELFCYFNGFINTLFSLSSILTICSITIFQYVSIVLPLERMLTRFRCLVMVVSLWCISGFLAMGPIVHWGRYEFTSNIFNCDYYRSNHKSELTYNIILMIAGFLFPLGIMLFSYISIYRALRKHSSRMSRTSTISTAPVEGAAVSIETKIGVTILLVMTTFLVCRTPFFLYLFFVVFKQDNTIDVLGQLSFWAVYLHSASDPFIFAFKHAEYQDTLRDIYRTLKLALTSDCCGNTDGMDSGTKPKTAGQKSNK